MTLYLPRRDRTYRRPLQIPDHKSHPPSVYDVRRFRLAYRPDKIVADIRRQAPLYLVSSDRLLPIAYFDRRSRLVRVEILTCRRCMASDHRVRLVALGYFDAADYSAMERVVGLLVL